MSLATTNYVIAKVIMNFVVNFGCCTFVTILLVVWSTNDDGSALTEALTSKASSNLLNDDTYQCICASNCVIHPDK